MNGTMIHVRVRILTSWLEINAEAFNTTEKLQNISFVAVGIFFFYIIENFLSINILFSNFLYHRKLSWVPSNLVFANLTCLYCI